MPTASSEVSVDRTAQVYDVHAHHFPHPGLAVPVPPGDDRWPRLVEDNPRQGRVVVGDSTFRIVDPSLWDLEERLAAMEAAGVARQLVSPMPVLLTYWADVDDALPFARAVNDALASDVAASGGRLQGLATVPLQAPGAAAEELRRAVTELGLRGIEIGSHAGAIELDSQELDPLWSVAEELDAVVFVHPREGGGDAVRRHGPPYDFGLGMLTDTAMAAVALTSGGVLDRHPALRVGLAHGCGTFPWAFPRLRIGARHSSDPTVVDRYEQLTRRLWVDSLVFDPLHLDLLVTRFGADHVMFGSDFPFIPGMSEEAAVFIGTAVRQGGLSEEQAAGVLRGNFLSFLGIPDPPSGEVC